MNDNADTTAPIYEILEAWDARISTLIMTSSPLDLDEMKRLLTTLRLAAKALTPARVIMKRKVDANALRGDAQSWSDTPMG
jgi:hypothetical protein